MTTTSSPRPFTPSQEEPEDLERRTVGRKGALATLAQRLRSAATGRSRPHTLLVGPRGSGKTHLLRVALHQVDQVPGVHDRLAIADISEDVIGITRYTDLLWEIGAALRLRLARSTEPVELEAAILAGIGDRTLVLVLENLDRVFRALGTPGQQNLRSWVETSGRVMLLAATPALFAGVIDRSQPWFAGLITTPVEGLSATEGRELLTILARESGDDALVDFLQSERGRGRLEAVARLTGGSARIWMVLSGCLTVDNLNALVPAVEELIERLVPYYQQLLWDLPANHQAIVRQLAEGPAAALTAVDIAAATGLSQQTVSKALLLLQEGRWVLAEKIGGDRRRTWYSLREPMLRHHFQWRATHGEPLALIVELLRAWYEPRELRRYLASVYPQSPAEAYLTESLSVQPLVYDDAYDQRDPDALVAEARRWMTGSSDVFTRDCGRYVEACVQLAAEPELDVLEHLSRRVPTSPADATFAAGLTTHRGAGLAVLLVAAAGTVDGDTGAGLALVAAGWIGREDPQTAVELLAGAPTGPRVSVATGFAVQVDAAFWRAYENGRPEADLADASELLPKLIGALGPDHNLSLRLRSNLAGYPGRAGDLARALTLYRELLPDVGRGHGADHPDTLATRAHIAHCIGETGDLASALSMYRELLPVREHALGADHPDTLMTRVYIAYYSGQTGDPASALSQYRQLLPDQERVLGADHRDTLTTRSLLAVELSRAGEGDEAVKTLGTNPMLLGSIIDVFAAAAQPPSGPALLVLMWSALHGDAEAEVKLPAELREIVATKRAGRR